MRHLTPASGQLGRYTTGVRDAEKHSSKLTSTSKRLGSSLASAAKYAAGAALAYIGIAKAEQAVQATQDLAKTTISLNQNLGIGIKVSSRWGAVLQARGVDATKAGMAFKTFASQVDAAVNGSKTAQAQFEALGITQKDLVDNQHNVQKLLLMSADGFDKLGAGTARTTAESKLFGRGWATVAPLMRDGSAALKDNLDVTKQYGDELNKHTLKAQQELLSSQRESKIAWQGLQVQFTTAVTPALIEVEDQFQRVARIMADPRLSSDEKFSKISKIIEGDLSKAMDFVIGEIPDIADRVGEEAPKIAEGFINGFLDSNAWGKLALGAWIITKLGLGRTVLSGIGAQAGAQVVGGVETGMESRASSTTFASRFKGRLVGIAKGIGLAMGITGVIGGLSETLNTTDLPNMSPFEAHLNDFFVGFGRQFGIDLGQTTSEEFQKEFEVAMANAAKGVGLRGFWKDVGKGMDPGGFAITRSSAKKIVDGTISNVRLEFHHVNGQKVFGPLWDNIKSDESKRRAAHDIIDALNAANQLAVKEGIVLPPRVLRLSPDTVPHLAKQLSNGLDFLRKHAGASMGDITKIVRKNTQVIDSLLGKGTDRGRAALRQNFLLAAENIAQAMKRGDINTKDGMDRIEQLIRRADLVSPTRKIAKDFGDEWAHGLDRSSKVTKQGVKNMLDDLGKMPPAARDIAAKTALNHLKEVQHEGDITGAEYRKIKSSILSTYTDIRVGGAKQTHLLTKNVGTGLLDLAVTTLAAMQNIGLNTNQALKSLGVDKAISFVWKSIKGAAGIPGKQQGGALAGVVPGYSVGDTHTLSLNGVPIAKVESQEGVFVGNRTMMAQLDELNSRIPRRAEGGYVDVWGKGLAHLAGGGIALPGAGVHRSYPMLSGDTDFIPAMGNALSAMARARHTPISVASGFRTYAEQAALYARYLAGGTLAARPGSSNHERGIAADISPGQSTFGSIASRFGLAFDVPGESWHVDLVKKLAGIKGVAGAPGGAATAPAWKNIARVLLQGPDGPWKSSGQAALDDVWKAANAYGRKHAPAATGTGGYVPGGSGSVLRVMDRVLKGAGLRSHTAIPAIMGNSYGESNWNPDAINPSNGGGGLFGFLVGEKSIGALHNYAAAHHGAWDDPEIQTNFMLSTMPQSMRDAMNQLSLDAGVVYFLKNWEVAYPQGLSMRLAGAHKAQAMGYAEGGIAKLAELAKGGIAMVGDSLGVGMKDVGGFGDRWKLNVLGGRRSDQGVPVLKSMLGKDIDTVLWELGTNDLSPSMTKGALNRVRKMIGDRGLGLMTIHRPSGGAKAINDVIRNFPGVADDAIADWEHLAGQHPEWLSRDPSHVHPNSTGYKAMQRIVETAGETARRAMLHDTGGKGPKDVPAEGLDPNTGLPHKIVHRRTQRFLRPFLSKLRKLNLDPSVQQQINALSTRVGTLDAYAGYASGLDTDTGHGQFHGRTEAEWLTKELPVLLGLRNALVNAHKVLERMREMASRALANAQKRARHLKKDSRDLFDQIRDLQHVSHHRSAKDIQQALIEEQRKKKPDPKRLKELHKEYVAANKVQALTNRTTVEQAELDGLKGVIGHLNSRRSALTSKENDLESSLIDIQGPHGGHKQLWSLPPLGTLGGTIFDVQSRLWQISQDDASGSAADTSGTDSERISLLEQLLQQAQQRATVSESLYPVLQKLASSGFGDLVPMAGMLPSFGGGGIVPGHLGEPSPILAHGAEGVFTPEQMAAMGPAGPMDVQIIFKAPFYTEARSIDELLDVKISDRERKAAVKARLNG